MVNKNVIIQVKHFMKGHNGHYRKAMICLPGDIIR